MNTGIIIENAGLSIQKESHNSGKQVPDHLILYNKAIPSD